MRSPQETALLVALLLKKSGQKRARVSTETIRRLSQRKQLRGAFIELLEKYLDVLGLILIEIERGGYGLIPSSALEGAPAITAKKYLADVLDRLRRGEIDFDDIQNEINDDIDLDQEDDS